MSQKKLNKSQGGEEEEEEKLMDGNKLLDR